MVRIDEQTYRVNFQCVSMEYELAAWLQNFQADNYFSGELKSLKIWLERQGVLLGTDSVRKQNGSCHYDTMRFQNTSPQGFPRQKLCKMCHSVPINASLPLSL